MSPPLCGSRSPSVSRPEDSGRGPHLSTIPSPEVSGRRSLRVYVGHSGPTLVGATPTGRCNLRWCVVERDNAKLCATRLT